MACIWHHLTFLFMVFYLIGFGVVQPVKQMNTFETKISNSLLDPSPANVMLRSKRDISNNETGCRIFPANVTQVNGTIRDMIKDKRVQLIEYTIRSNDSQMDDLVWNTGKTPVYKPYKWTRVASVHGRALLALVFNYEVVSLKMLSFGVNKLDIFVEEEGCNTLEERENALRLLVYNDFVLDTVHEASRHREVCNQIIKGIESHAALFKKECYRKAVGSGELVGEVVYNRWIEILQGLLEFVRVFIILFAPLIFQSWLYTGDLQSSVPYVVHVEKKHNVELTMKSSSKTKESPVLDDTIDLTTPLKNAHGCHVPMTKLRSCIKNKSFKLSSSKVHVKTKKLNIVVDHTKLMAQSAVPVNVVSFIKNELIGCGLLNRAWIKSCAAAGCIFGRWPKGLRPGGNDLDPNFPPKVPTWGRLFRLLAGLVLATIIIPLPFHVRVIVYSLTEAPEMESRLEAARSLGVSDLYYQNFWFGVEWPVVISIVYITYIVTLMVFALSQYYFFNAFDDIIQDCIFDLQSISYSSILSMIFYHLVLPFKEFGCFIGLFAAIPYYIFVMPIAVLISLFYGIPTFYMMGRLFYNFRPRGIQSLWCCGRGKNTDALNDDNEDTTSVDTIFGSKESSFTFSDMFNLDKISPENRLYPRLPVQRLKHTWHKHLKTKQSVYILPIFVSFMTMLLMLSLALMYAEALRFFLHVILLGLSGLVLNSSHVMDYFILSFWTFMYCVQTLKTIHSKYNQMSQHMFSFFKGHLSEKVGDATRVPEEVQMFTGFKYFNYERLQNIKETMKMYMHKHEVENFNPDTEDRLIRNELGDLEWEVHGLVFFVDTQDLPRIPKRLFWKICDELRAPGCPGPLQQSLADACKQLAYMLIFLFVVFIIIMSFHDVFDPSSNNQLLLTMASGFLPLIIRQLIPGSPKVDLSEYSLKGKIEEILLHYRESWPVYDVVDESDADDDDANIIVPEDVEKAASKESADKEDPNSNQRFLEDDLDDMDIIVAEEVSAVGSAPLAKMPAGIHTGKAMTPKRSISTLDEGSMEVDFSPPQVRLPRYLPRERLLTFATKSGPKEVTDDVLEPVVRTINEVEASPK